MAEHIKKLSISNAWGEAAKFVASEASLLAPIAILLLALPSVIIGIAGPDPTTDELPGLSFFLLLIPLIFLTGVGSLAITVLALRSGISVAEALRVAARRFLPLFAASMLIAIGVSVILLPIILLVGASAYAGSVAAAGLLLLILLILIPVGIYIWARISMMSPIAAEEGKNPIGIINRSWALTKGVTWKLAAAYILLVVAFTIVMTVVLLLIGILVAGIGGTPEHGSLGQFVLLLVQGALTAIFTVYFQAFLARIYVQLAAAQSSGI